MVGGGIWVGLLESGLLLVFVCFRLWFGGGGLGDTEGTIREGGGGVWIREV